MDDSENVDYGSALLRGTKVFGNFMKIHMVYRLSEGLKYTIKIRDASKSCVVSVIDKTQNRWIARVDMAHKNVPYKHININPKYAKIAKDPHIKIPSVGMQAGKFAAKTAKVLNKANEVIGPALLIADIGCVGYAAYKDYSEGTISNTTNTVTKIGSGYLSSYAGSVIGTTIGTIIFPGIGTIAFGYAGAIYAGYYGMNKMAPMISNTLLNNTDEE